MANFWNSNVIDIGNSGENVVWKIDINTLLVFRHHSVANGRYGVWNYRQLNCVWSQNGPYW